MEDLKQLGVNEEEENANRTMTPEQAIEVTAESNDWQLSPQPATDYAEFLNMHLAEGDRCEITVYDITGRVLSLQEFANMEYPVRINLTGFTPGMYSYRVVVNGNVVNSGTLAVK